MNKHFAALGAGVSTLMLTAPAFAAADPVLVTAGDNVTAITGQVDGISTVATGVVVALLGASLILWAAAVGFKALRRGFK